MAQHRAPPVFFVFVCVGGVESALAPPKRPFQPLDQADALGLLNRRLAQVGAAAHGRLNRSKKAAAEKPRR